jgi:long-chain acyl-CoA synthetase
VTGGAHPAIPAGVFDVLDGALHDRPDHPALITAHGQTTYSELDDLARRAAGALRGLGVKPGDRVAASLPNDLDIIVAFHGAMRLGAVWVGINRVLAPPEKAYMVKDAGARLLITDDGATPDPATTTQVLSLAEWRDSLETSAVPDPTNQHRPDPFAPAAIAYTSGTTGFPKGAVHCQSALVMPGAATVARRNWGPELRKGDSLPLTILNMLCLTTLLTAQAGGTAVIMERADTDSVVDYIRTHRVTVWNGPPAQLHTLIRDESVKPEDLASLDEVWVGGGDCPDSLREGFERRFGVPVTRTYGLTEAPSLVSLDDRQGRRPAGTSGRPLDHIHVRTAADGELVLSPTRVGPWAGTYRPLLAYWKQPGPTKEVLAGAELHTGDLGLVDDDGHLRVLGRRSQMIIRGGANVYPAEVERVLVEAPGVQACVVVGVPDDRLGERVGAVIEPVQGCEADEAAILAHCRLALAGYKVPERVAFVEKLPRNQMGKVPRNAVLDILGGNIQP